MRFAIAALIALFAASASCQIVPRWNQPMPADPGPGSNPAAAVAADSAGNVIITGRAGSFYTAKYGARGGTVLWELRYEPPGHLGGSGHAITVDPAGNACVTGSFIYGLSNDPDKVDIYTAKYAADTGALLWERRYDSPADPGPSDSGPRGDWPLAIAGDGTGNVFVAGVSIRGGGEGEACLAKYAAANGAVLWERRYRGPMGLGCSFDTAGVDADGNVIVSGSANYERNVNGFWKTEIVTVKYAAADGAVLWIQRARGTGEPGSTAGGLALDPAGNACITGWTGMTGLSPAIYTAMYAAENGALIWEKLYRSPDLEDDAPSAIAVDAQGNVIVAGRSWYNQSRVDGTIIKYAAANGTILWEKRYNGPGGRDDLTSGVAVEATGDVVITGLTRTNAWLDPSEYYLIRYAAADGSLLWEKHLPRQSPIDVPVFPRLELTPTGGVVLTGNFRDPFFWKPVYFTTCYGPATAQQLWRNSHFGIYTSAGSAADHADPDGDGVPNLLEWGCGSDPTIPQRPPALPVPHNGGLALDYPRSLSAVADGAVFAVEWSNPPGTGSWLTGGVSESLLSGSGGVEHIRAAVPGGGTQRFARLRISTPP